MIGVSLLCVMELGSPSGLHDLWVREREYHGYLSIFFQQKFDTFLIK